MSTIVAIGGGEIINSETYAIDKFIIDRSGKESPNVLFVPTASGDNEDYCDVFKNYYTKLGARVTNLILSNPKLSYNEAEEKIMTADVVYVGGGNTDKMLRTWEQNGVPKLFKQLSEEKPDSVLSGLSAGAICWFEYGATDSLRFDNPDNHDIYDIKGLGYIKSMIASPHHVREKAVREPAIKALMQKLGQTVTGVAIDDCAAVVFQRDRQDKEYIIEGSIVSQSGRNARQLLLSKNGKGIIEQNIPSVLLAV